MFEAAAGPAVAGQYVVITFGIPTFTTQLLDYYLHGSSVK